MQMNKRKTSLMMVQVLYYTWKLCSVVFSHFVMISLVVAYCILGAVTFEKLEAGYEREVGLPSTFSSFLLLYTLGTYPNYLAISPISSY